MNTKGPSGVIELDCSKAFDNISHTKLLHHRITSNTNNWVKAFLVNRSQQIMVNDQDSSPAAVLSGVVQGTFLGPRFFLL